MAGSVAANKVSREIWDRDNPERGHVCVSRKRLDRTDQFSKVDVRHFDLVGVGTPMPVPCGSESR